jgi:hypothetical protein
MTYRITFTLDDADTATFLREVGPHLGKMTVSHIGDYTPGVTVNRTMESPPAPTTEPAPVAVKKKAKKRKPAKLRGSKVNDIILATIKHMGGSATVRMLKQALEDAGMSAGSLSTGLAALQKSKAIERVGDGLYADPNRVRFPAADVDEPAAEPAPEPAAA